MSLAFSYKRMSRRESKLFEQSKRMSGYKLKRTNTLSVSLEDSIFATDNDVTQLKDLTEKSLLTTIKNRFAKDNIYTFAGPILISVNPYYFMPIHNPKYVKFYQGVRLHDLPPHVFAIADAAYQDMLKEDRNQSIIIGGESGSGKTETTKFLLKHLTSLSGMLLPQDILDYIIYAGPVLEAFGNATTLHNHNSSRFGKYVTLCFNETGTCRGAFIEKYLLEQCRLVSQEDGERNFHVFYYLLSGATDQLKQDLYLNNSTQYSYLSRSNITPTKSDIDGFTRLCNLLTSLRIDGRLQFNIFSILSAILHLGNLKFKYSDITAVIDSSTKRELNLVSELLKVSQTLLTQTLKNRLKTVGSEKILIPCTYDQMIQTRDSLAKALYSSLFDWILFRINDILKGKIAMSEVRIRTIGILDIFGFENVCNNSFEQFCINYANEQLHHYFMDFVLKAEQDEYMNDKIEWKHIAYKDNTGCINLFSKRPKGLFVLINDESTMPGGNDLSLYDKFISCHKNSSYFKTPQLKHQSPNFTVSHFAGSVTYHIKQFTEKNTDLMSHSIIELLRTSEDYLVRELIGAEPIGRLKWRKLGIVFRAVQNFKSTLTTRLNSSSPESNPPAAGPKHTTLVIPSLNSNFKTHEAFHEEHSVSKNSEPTTKLSYNKKEGQAGNSIRFMNSYTPIGSPLRLPSRRRNKKKSYNSKSKPPPDKPRFNSFDVQEMRGAPTVVSQYQTSLQNLLVQLSSANPFFIKCIRSNASQQPKYFNDEVVKYQLNYSGLFEAIQVRQAGYSIRMTFQSFLFKYQPLIRQQPNDVRPSHVIINDFLKQQYLPPNSFQVGKTKVFIRGDEGLCLDEQLNSIILRRIVFLQKSVRIWLAKRRNTRFRQSIITAQAYSRGYLLRLLIQKQLNAIISIQSAWRGYATRRFVKKLKTERADLRNIRRTSNKCRQYIINDNLGYAPLCFPPRQDKLRKRKSMFEGLESSYPKSDINPKTSATITMSNPDSNNFRKSYLQAVHSTQYKIYESRDNDSNKYDLSKVKRKYEDNVLSPRHMKARSSSVEIDKVRPGSVNEMIQGLELDKHPMNLPNRTSQTLSRYSFLESSDHNIINPAVQKYAVSYSKSYDFNSTSFTPNPPPRTPPKDIFTKLIKSHCNYLNNMPLERETIFKQNSSLHLSNNSRFNAEMFQEKLTSPLPTNYNHIKVKRSRAKPVVRREAIRVVSPSIERPYFLPCSPLASANNFFPKVVQDDNTDGHNLSSCVMSSGRVPKRNRNVELIKVKSLADISPFELIFEGKVEREGSPFKSSLSLTQSVDSKREFSEFRPRAITVSTLNPGSKGLTRSLHLGSNKSIDSPLHPTTTVQSRLYSFASSPFKRDRPRKDKRLKGKVKTGLLQSYAHGHEPKQYNGASFQKVPCNKCMRLLHPPFLKGKVFRCALCNQIFHENCMPFANTCPSSSGDVVIARNLSDMGRLISFLLDKKDALSERPRQKDTMDDFYILTLERMHANMLASTSLKAQMLSQEAMLSKTQTITIRNMLHDFSLLLTPIVSDTKSQLMLRNVFMNLLEDYLIERSREDSDPNSTVPTQAIKVLQRRKEIQKPKLILGHTFLEKHFNVLTVCEFCDEPMSLVESGQYCQACDYVCHKSCLSHVKSPCVTCCETLDENDTKTEKLSHFGRSLNSLSKSHTELPPIFELCLKSIESTGLMSEGIYRKCSAKSKVTRFIAAIDEDLENVDWESYDVHAMCSGVKTFLNELPDPLLTFDLYDRCIIAAKISERTEKVRAIQAILQLLPPMNYKCLERLVFHMAQICKLEEHNKMCPHSLAIIFAPVLLRSPDDMPLIELAKVMPLQTVFLQIIIEEHLKKLRETMDDLEQLDRARRNTIRKIKQITQDDNKSDSGIFDQALQEDPVSTLRWKQLNTQLADIETQQFSLTIELARLDLGDSSAEDSSSHDSMEAMID
ncbi:Unconventional myosin-IXa [Oopsacas minuta]|uniref:Unconventional myosin-IXa n=1 Tax=Oopsacas minuta TaxID=111878 RepID=A0AAV7JZE2_9METZ|nr:Unconventional myosin-IXa [Oopsacas minuta]